MIEGGYIRTTVRLRSPPYSCCECETHESVRYRCARLWTAESEKGQNGILRSYVSMLYKEWWSAKLFDSAVSGALSASKIVAHHMALFVPGVLTVPIIWVIVNIFSPDAMSQNPAYGATRHRHNIPQGRLEGMAQHLYRVLHSWSNLSLYNRSFMN